MIKDKLNKKNNEYHNKINYIFKKNPHLKYKEDIINTNFCDGFNDIFEVFLSYKDNKEYIISSNKNYNLEVFILLDNKKILSLKGHENHITSIKYFINNKNYDEYIISSDKKKIIIIWDITNNYIIKYKINTNYGDFIYSCLLLFPHNNKNNDNYIISSTVNTSDNNDQAATKIYSLNNGKFIKYINDSNNNRIYYLLSWYNKINNKYYIIQLTSNKIIINNLLEEELYSEFIHVPEDTHCSGFITYNKENNDYLCCSSENGYINIWDLYKKKIFKIIIANNCCLYNIIEWNKKYIIVADYYNESFKIIDIDIEKVISDIKGQHINGVICIKKIKHPIYGESLLSASEDKTIKLWTL